MCIWMLKTHIGYLLATGRPGGIGRVGWTVGKPSPARTVAVHHVNIRSDPDDYREPKGAPKAPPTRRRRPAEPSETRTAGLQGPIVAEDVRAVAQVLAEEADRLIGARR
jgi:hypothetical protein